VATGNEDAGQQPALDATTDGADAQSAEASLPPEDGSGDSTLPSDASEAGPSDAGDSGQDAGVVDSAARFLGGSNGSAIAVSPDGMVAVAVNRDVGTATILSLASAASAPPTVTASVELPLGSTNTSTGTSSEPWQVVISPDSSSAYVVLRKDQLLVKITGLEATPAVASTSAPLGSEPTGVALTPTGATAWVTNWVDGTLTRVDTASMTSTATVDLNAPLVSTGYLGAIAPRPALAHPRSIAITNSGFGYDDDETAYVTEYFAQATAPEASNGRNADTRKVGVVYQVSMGSGHAVGVVTLSALADMGFQDQNGGTAGCYPNQLQAIAMNGKYAYVLSVCASPEGPIGPSVTTVPCGSVTDCAAAGPDGGAMIAPACVQTSASTGSFCVDQASVKTTTAPLLSIIDTSLLAPAEVPLGPTSLNAAFDALFDSYGLPATGARAYPLLANDLAFAPGSSVGYISANGADAVYTFQYVPDAGDAGGIVVGPGAGGDGGASPPFASLAPTGLNPTGIAMVDGRYAVTVNEVSRNAVFVDTSAEAVAQTTLPDGGTGPVAAPLTALPAPNTQAALVLAGRRFFNTGTGRWSLAGQAWGACQACHTDGLTDNVTWYFPRGPRQSVSLDGTYDKAQPLDQRILNWTAVNDEVADFEGNVRSISGGVGAIVVQTSPTGPSPADRMNVAAPCTTATDDAGACLDGTGELALNGSATLAAEPSNPLGLTAPAALSPSDWDAISAYMQQIRSPLRPTTLSATSVAAGQKLFHANGCPGCHGGPKWTISQLFYAPGPLVNAALRTKAWTPPNGFPPPLLPAQETSAQVMRFAGLDPAAASSFDQILCILRSVGTFGVADNAAGIAELRSDMTTVAQGAGNPTGDGAGYNPPSLLGLVTGAPYFHAGNTQTLEGVLGSTFRAHGQALAPKFQPTQADVANLVQYLLSIDEKQLSFDIPAPGPTGGNFCLKP
jgi:hypothetical protein